MSATAARDADRATDVEASDAPPESLLQGFGRGAATRAALHQPATSEDLDALVAELFAKGRRLIPRGLGRAYGDAAQLAGGDVVSTTTLDRLHELDTTKGIVRADAGLSIDALLRASVPTGWFVPATPGTRQVTLGGAVAADVHGKNHHREGSFGRHLLGLRLLSPSGPATIAPDSDSEAFWATVGGMGLTGVVSEVELQMIPVESAYISVDTDRTADLEETMALLADGDDRYRYSVAWIDCLASGKALGRSVLTRGDHARAADLEGARADAPLDYAPRAPFRVPVAPPFSPLNGWSGRLLNEAWFRKAPRHKEREIQLIASFFYPLDALDDWNLLYGPHGFTQYQLVVPFGAEETVRKVIEQLQADHQPALLGVLKRFGGGSPAPLSFPAPGWTLAVDIPLGRPGLADSLDRCDDLVLRAGGRVYFAKDGRLSPSKVAAMYPRLAEWRSVADRLDPHHQLASDLAERLHLRTETAKEARP